MLLSHFMGEKGNVLTADKQSFFRMELVYVIAGKEGPAQIDRSVKSTNNERSEPKRVLSISNLQDKGLAYDPEDGDVRTTSCSPQLREVWERTDSLLKLGSTKEFLCESF